MTLIGLACVYNDPRVPTELGGTGTVYTPGLFWPFLTADQNAKIYRFLPTGSRLYCIIMHGYQFQSIIVQVLFKRDQKNFRDMMLHHVCATLSTNYCYFTNHEDFSIGATLITSISDVCLNFGKTVRDIGFKPVYVTASYLIILISWIITRIYYFTYACYGSTKKFWPGQRWPLNEAYTDLYNKTKFGFRFVMVNLALLTCLNFFWFYFILLIGYRKLFKGKGGFYDKRNKSDAIPGSPNHQHRQVEISSESESDRKLTIKL